MMAAKPLMSLVVRAAAMEKAAIVAISRASTHAEQQQAGRVQVEAEHGADGHDHHVEGEHQQHGGQDRAGQDGEPAGRGDPEPLGDPGPQLEDRAEAGAAEPLAKASRARMPGRKRSSTFPAGRPGAPTRCLSRGVNRAR